jgi:hypothetical protein
LMSVLDTGSSGTVKYTNVAAEHQPDGS